MNTKLWQLLGLLILPLIFVHMDWSSVKEALVRANLVLIAMAFLLNVPLLFLTAMRWRYLLTLQGYQLSKRATWIYYLGGLYLGFVTPGRIGDLGKGFFLRKAGIATLSRSLSSVVVDRLLDLYLLLLLATLGIMWRKPFPASFPVGLALLAVVVFFPFVFNFLSLPRGWAKDMIQKRLLNWFPVSVRKEAEEFASGMRLLPVNNLFVALFFTVMAQAIFFQACWLIAVAYSIPISYLELVPIMAMTNLITFIPVSIAGLGTREAALLVFLNRPDITTEQIILYSLSVFFVFFAGGGLLGYLGWILSPVYISRKQAKAELSEDRNGNSSQS